MNPSSVRPARESDLPGILAVLSHYNFKVLTPVDGAFVDDGMPESIKLYNEVSELNLGDGFVAEHDGNIVGFAHFKKYDDTTAKTTLISVDPAYAGRDFGKALQKARMEKAWSRGYSKMITFCDNPKACEWYRRHFGYEITGSGENCHRLHFIPTAQGTVWGVHYGFYDNPTVAVLETDLNRFFAGQ